MLAVKNRFLCKSIDFDYVAAIVGLWARMCIGDGMILSTEYREERELNCTVSLSQGDTTSLPPSCKQPVSWIHTVGAGDAPR